MTANEGTAEAERALRANRVSQLDCRSRSVVLTILWNALGSGRPRAGRSAQAIQKQGVRRVGSRGMRVGGECRIRLTGLEEIPRQRTAAAKPIIRHRHLARSNRRKSL
jgi:hypothetical protein